MIILALLSTLLAATQQPDVFFISVDTLRADYLGCYGFPHPASPNIDALAGQSLVFDDCLVDIPLTGPSFSAMFTSRYPRTTGAVRNGLPTPPEIPLITEQFQAAGYQTFCVQSNWPLKDHLSGLARGFDVYEEGFRSKRWGFMKPERRADEVTEVALELLEQRDPDRPLFFWVHYTDPHAPYRFRRRFNPMDKRRWFTDRETWTAARYASEVAFMDHHLGKVLEALPTSNAYVLFVSDHGESLHEHGYLGHGRRVYQSIMRVPLMVRGPGIEPGRTDAPARGLDVGPTLLGLARLDPFPGMLGVDLLAGDPPADRARVVETYGGAVPGLPGAQAIMADRPPQRRAVVADGWKLILGGEGPQLFHIAEDPRELSNLASRRPGLVAELRARIEEWEERWPRQSGPQANLDEEDLDALRSLGYLD